MGAFAGFCSSGLGQRQHRFGTRGNSRASSPEKYRNPVVSRRELRTTAVFSASGSTTRDPHAHVKIRLMAFHQFCHMAARLLGRKRQGSPRTGQDYGDGYARPQEGPRRLRRHLCEHLWTGRNRGRAHPPMLDAFLSGDPGFREARKSLSSEMQSQKTRKPRTPTGEP